MKVRSSMFLPHLLSYSSDAGFAPKLGGGAAPHPAPNFCHRLSPARLPCERLGTQPGKTETGGRGGSWVGENAGPIVGRDREAAVLITSQLPNGAERVPAQHPEPSLCPAAGPKASGASLLALFHSRILSDASPARLLLFLAQPGLHGRRQPVSAAGLCRRGDGIAVLLGSFLRHISGIIIAGNTSVLGGNCWMHMSCITPQCKQKKSRKPFENCQKRTNS